MKALRNIHRHIIARDSIEKISRTLEKEFPYTKVSKRTIKRDGYYNIDLEHIKSHDVDRFIKVIHETSHKHGVGAGIPIMIRYKKIEEN